MIKIIKSNNRCGAFYCKIKTKAKSYKKQEQREKGAEFAAKGKACDDDTHFEELTSMRGTGEEWATIISRATNAINWFSTILLSAYAFLLLFGHACKMANKRKRNNCNNSNSDNNNNNNNGKPKPTDCKCKWNWKLN